MPTRPLIWKALFAAGGALLGGTLCWIAWGLSTGGDFFAQGRVLAPASVIAAAVAGAYAGSKARRRSLRGALLVGDLLCVLFWTAVPNGWWATPPPPPGIGHTPLPR
jgi:hypothetical protein